MRHRAGLAHRLLDLFGIVFQRLVRSQHVVVGRDDGNARLLHADEQLLVQLGKGAVGMGLVGARQPLAYRPLADGGLDPGQVGLPVNSAAGRDSGGHGGNGVVNFGQWEFLEYARD